MKNFLTTILLLILFCGFTLFLWENNKLKTVLSVVSPTKIEVDLNNDKSPNKNELVCIDGIDSFSLNMDEDVINSYSKHLPLSKTEIISMGYLAQEFAQNTLLNQKVSLKYTKKQSKDCKFAELKLNGIDYSKLLLNNGFGLVNKKPANAEIFKKNLEKAKKLDLVILNHHSGKYHKLDCPYGNIAHDKIIMPKKQLPKDSKPCQYCHLNKKSTRLAKSTKNNKSFTIKNTQVTNIQKPSLIVSNGEIKVLYTDFSKNLKPHKNCTETVCKEVLKIIDNTKETLDIAIYGYDKIPAITNALIDAKNRGVKIRFVYDENSNPKKTYYKDNNIISNISTSYRSDKTSTTTTTNMLMHNKFLISDNHTVLTGSMNFSSSGFSSYDVNDIVIIYSTKIAEIYTKEFEQMLLGKFHTHKDKISAEKKYQIGNSQVEIYFSPKDKTSTRIIQIIKNAKHYIYIPTFLITHTQITNELINAKNRGVDVRLIIDANSTYTRNSKHTILRQNGILLKTENYAGKLHSKTIIVDDEYLITGSMNLSNSGENKNDENTVIIKNSQIAKHHKEFFLYLWTLIPDKYLKYNAKSESKDSIGSCSDGVDNNFNGKTDKEEDLCR